MVAGGRDGQTGPCHGPQAGRQAEAFGESSSVTSECKRLDPPLQHAKSRQLVVVGHLANAAHWSLVLSKGLAGRLAGCPAGWLLHAAVKNTGRWLCCTLPPLRQAACNGGPCVCAKGLPERGGAGCSRLGQSANQLDLMALRFGNLSAYSRTTKSGQPMHSSSKKQGNKWLHHRCTAASYGLT